MVINASQCQYAAGDRRSCGSKPAIFKTRRRIPLTSKNLQRFEASCGAPAVEFAGILVLGSGLTAKPRPVDTGPANGLQGPCRVHPTVPHGQPGVARWPVPALVTFAK